jgi:signal transduction histidine kinase
LEIQKEELHETNMELVELTNTKDKFYSIIAHDLKNPFITLYGYTELLKNEYYTLSDNEKIEYISELEAVTKKTHGLLENLLELASSRTGIIEQKPDKFYLGENVTIITELIKPQAKIKGIKINNYIDPGLSVYADKKMIEMVLRNLITNAVKFSSYGGIIKLNAFEKDETVTVTVEDNGVGMTDDELNNLMNKTTAHSTRGTNDEKGTGLGIEICKEFILKNKGKFWAESRLGEGSTFYFSLPKSMLFERTVRS